MKEIAGLRNPWNSCGPEVPQEPQHEEDDDEKFARAFPFDGVSAPDVGPVVGWANSTRYDLPFAGRSEMFVPEQLDLIRQPKVGKASDRLESIERSELESAAFMGRSDHVEDLVHVERDRYLRVLGNESKKATSLSDTIFARRNDGGKP